MFEDFIPGVRVRSLEAVSNLDAGALGTVVISDQVDKSVAVCWDEELLGGHTIDWRGYSCEDGHGWWINYKYLKLVEEYDDTNFDFDEAAFEQLLSV